MGSSYNLYRAQRLETPFQILLQNCPTHWPSPPHPQGRGPQCRFQIPQHHCPGNRLQLPLLHCSPWKDLQLLFSTWLTSDSHWSTCRYIWLADAMTCTTSLLQGVWNIFNFHLQSGRWALSYKVGGLQGVQMPRNQTEWQTSTNKYHGRKEENQKCLFLSSFSFLKQRTKEPKSIMDVTDPFQELFNIFIFNQKWVSILPEENEPSQRFKCTAANWCRRK